MRNKLSCHTKQVRHRQRTVWSQISSSTTRDAGIPGWNRVPPKRNTAIPPRSSLHKCVPPHLPLLLCFLCLLFLLLLFPQLHSLLHHDSLAVPTPYVPRVAFHRDRSKWTGRLVCKQRWELRKVSTRNFTSIRALVRLSEYIGLNGKFLRFRRDGVSISYTVICLSHFDVCFAIT
jgi:hypothetical protein